MAWVRFERVFTWRPSASVMRDEQPGVRNVPRHYAGAAVKAGAAVRVRAPRRGEPAE